MSIEVDPIEGEKVNGNRPDAFQVGRPALDDMWGIGDIPPPRQLPESLLQASDKADDNIFRMVYDDDGQVCRELTINAQIAFARGLKIDMADLIRAKHMMYAARGGRARIEYLRATVGWARSFPSRMGGMAGNAINAIRGNNGTGA